MGDVLDKLIDELISNKATTVDDWDAGYNAGLKRAIFLLKRNIGGLELTERSRCKPRRSGV